MQICNACRYCESLCAVFPAMTDMRTFEQDKLDYLANLCHQCGACFQACQYAPPHPFAVNVKQALSQQRAESYARFSPSSMLWNWAQKTGVMAGVLLSVLFSVVLIVAAWIKAPAALFGAHGGDFYQIMPHGVMALLGLITFGIGIGGLVLAGVRFWRNAPADGVTSDHWRGATRDAATLKYLGDDLCLQERDDWRQWQRRAHHYMTGGFLLCFVATSLGTVYHYLFSWQAPYVWHSLPALAGIIGGVMMAFGTTALMLIKMMAPSTGDEATRSMDVSLIFLLWGVAVTGLLLRAFGDTPALGITLMVHLGFVFAFFISLPFSKMLHVPLRWLALLRYQMRVS